MTSEQEKAAASEAMEVCMRLKHALSALGMVLGSLSVVRTRDSVRPPRIDLGQVPLSYAVLLTESLEAYASGKAAEEEVKVTD
ncbi:hypothetical protein ABT160_04445 [Streptomyces sp. NPDC001941]|uniref:hypothetical protein n=1 Tax=Streptomyces sp. NPDC001941 TaxID=3154659 RepID=UPI0033290F98